MIAPTFAECRALRAAAGAPWFDRPFDLNLLVVRDGLVGTWGDLVVVATVDDAGRELVEAFVATGDASRSEWLKPKHVRGCLYTLDQHVAGGLAPGLHKGRKALRQVEACDYVRWARNSGRVPTVAELEALGQTSARFTDLRGTHVHNRVSGRTPAAPRPGDSEGCTVLLYRHQHTALLRLVEEQRLRYGSATVSPTYCTRGPMSALAA